MRQSEKEYAEGLFLLAREEGREDEFLNSLLLLRSLFQENEGYLELLSSPAVPLSERIALLDEAFRKNLPEEIVSFLMLLCERGRIGELYFIIEDFEEMHREFQGMLSLTITSAIPLVKEQAEKLCLALEKKLGKKISPVFQTDPTLLGGIRVEGEGILFDGSVRKQLREIKDVMIG